MKNSQTKNLLVVTKIPDDAIHYHLNDYFLTFAETGEHGWVVIPPQCGRCRTFDYEESKIETVVHFLKDVVHYITYYCDEDDEDDEDDEYAALSEKIPDWLPKNVRYTRKMVTPVKNWLTAYYNFDDFEQYNNVCKLMKIFYGEIWETKNLKGYSQGDEIFALFRKDVFGKKYKQYLRFIAEFEAYVWGGVSGFRIYTTNSEKYKKLLKGEISLSRLDEYPTTEALPTMAYDCRKKNILKNALRICAGVDKTTPVKFVEYNDYEDLFHEVKEF